MHHTLRHVLLQRIFFKNDSLLFFFVFLSMPFSFRHTLPFVLSGVIGGLLVVSISLGVLLSPLRSLVPGFSGAPTAQTPLFSFSEDEDAIPSVVEAVNPAVVSIVISRDVPIIEQYYENPFEGFGGFSFRVPRYRQNGTERQEVGGGSGFLISADGYVVTNSHVVQEEDAEYTVLTNTEEKYTARVVAKDAVLDIAVLKIEAEGLPYLEFGDSDALRLGERVIAIGNALGEFRNTVSVGVISGLSRSIVAGNGVGSSERLENIIQTDAAINPGNSGGPLLNMEGEVIGVNVAVAQGSENIGFSLPANAVSSAVESIREHGRVIRPFLGVRYRLIDEALREANSLAVEHGALITRGETVDELAVIPGSPADKAGLVENDIILEVDGIEIDETHSLASLLRTKQVGDRIVLRVLHRGVEGDVPVMLEEQPEER